MPPGRTTKKKAAPETAAEQPTEDPSRPQQQVQRVREGERADVVRLKPTPISEADRKKLNLWQKRSLMIEELGTVPKRGWNDFHKYNYVMEADVVAYLGPLMAKYMVAVSIDVLLDLVQRIDMPTTRSGGQMVLTRLPLQITIINGDNPEERESVTWMGEGSDTGDKGVYKSYTGALKYFYMKWFLIATGDDPEAFERTDAMNESGGSRGIESVSNGGPGNTDVRRVEGRRQPERGGRQHETTEAQIKNLSNLTQGLGLTPPQIAEEIDRVLETNLVDTLAALDDEVAQRVALAEFLKGRPGTDTGKVIYHVTQIAQNVSQQRSESEVAAAAPYGGGEDSEEDMLERARAEQAEENARIGALTEEAAAEESGATKEELDGGAS